MSSDAIARVDTFAVKAGELAHKGYLLRAAENFGRAAEAARALGADNLVAVNQQMRQGNVLAVFATAPEAASRTDSRILAAHRAESIVLLTGAIAALERRRASGTLLEGKCAAVEEAWRAGVFRRNHPNMPADLVASLAALFGYEQFLGIANNALDVLACAHLFAAECSDAQKQSFAQHVVQAAALMHLPRRKSGMPMPIEAEFTDALRRAVDVAGANGLDTRLVRLLAGALHRLQHSGVLRARHVEKSIKILAPMQEEMSAALQSSLTAPDLRSCALPGCGAREAHPAHFKSCAACRTVVYCCREHQVAGWPSHKKACKAARTAAEDEAGPSGA